MANKRKIEVFSADCSACQEAVEVIKAAACPSCEVTVHDMKDSSATWRGAPRRWASDQCPRSSSTESLRIVAQAGELMNAFCGQRA
jgi:hypothetical protein